LEEFGWTDPILTNQDGVFADGGNGLASALPNGEFYAPVYHMNDLSDEQRRRLRLIANQLKGKHNKELEEEEWTAYYQVREVFQLRV
jgi:hypothetical protein